LPATSPGPASPRSTPARRRRTAHTPGHASPPGRPDPPPTRPAHRHPHLHSHSHRHLGGMRSQQQISLTVLGWESPFSRTPATAYIPKKTPAAVKPAPVTYRRAKRTAGTADRGTRRGGMSH
jgi:hypothetical protein